MNPAALECVVSKRQNEEQLTLFSTSYGEAKVEIFWDRGSGFIEGRVCRDGEVVPGILCGLPGRRVEEVEIPSVKKYFKEVAVGVQGRRIEVWPRLLGGMDPGNENKKKLSIFISYDSRDDSSRNAVNGIKEEIEKGMHSSIVFKEEPEGAAEWQKFIREEMQKADLVLLYVTKQYLKSEFCLGRIFEAMKILGDDWAKKMRIICDSEMQKLLDSREDGIQYLKECADFWDKEHDAIEKAIKEATVEVQMALASERECLYRNRADIPFFIQGLRERKRSTMEELKKEVEQLRVPGKSTSTKMVGGYLDSLRYCREEIVAFIKNNVFSNYWLTSKKVVKENVKSLEEKVVPLKKTVSPKPEICKKYTVPISSFIGREHELREIENRFTSVENCEDGIKIVVLKGLGGVGKTQLARKFVADHHVNYNVVYSFDGQSEEVLNEGYRDLAYKLEIDRDGVFSMADVRNRVTDWLGKSSNKGWLLFFDNVDNLETLDFLRKILPQRGGYVLITSRMSLEEDGLECFEIKEFGRSESIDLLEKVIRKERQSDRETLDNLAKALGDLPLALSQAGAYIDSFSLRGYNAAKYLESFGKNYVNVASKFDKFKGARDYHSRTIVTTTWNKSRKYISAYCPLADEALCLLAYFNPEEIFTGWIEKWLEKRGISDADKGTLNEIIKALYNDCSMIRYEEAEERIFIHRLVQQVIREGSEVEKQKVFIREALDLVGKEFDCYDEREVSTREVGQQCLPHAMSLVEYAKDNLLDEKTLEGKADLCRQIGSYIYNVQGMALQAEEYLEMALGIYEKICEKGHLKVAEVLDSLGNVRRTLGGGDINYNGKTTLAQNNFLDALNIYREIYRQNPSEDNRKILLDSLMSFGNFSMELGVKLDAIVLYEEAWEMVENNDTFEIADKVVLRANLAEAWEGLNEERAKKIYELVSMDWEEWNHAHQTQERNDNDAIALSKFGEAYWKLRKKDEAKSFYQQALDRACSNEVRGLMAIKCGDILFKCRETKATILEKYYLAKNTYEACYGNNHPDVAAAWEKLGDFQFKINLEEIAMPVSNETDDTENLSFLDIDVLGDGACLFRAIALGLQLNEYTELSHNNLRSIATSYLAIHKESHSDSIKAQLTDLFNQNRGFLGDPDNLFNGIPTSFKAKLTRVLEANQEETYINSNESVNDYINHMFDLTAWGGDIELGVLANLLQLEFLVYNDSFAVTPYHRVGAPQNPKMHLLNTGGHYKLRIPKVSNLRNEPVAGVDCYKKALNIYEIVYGGAPHPKSASVLQKLGDVYNESEGKMEEVIKCYEQAFSIYKDVYGEFHADSDAIREKLNRIFQELGNTQKANEFKKKTQSANILKERSFFSVCVNDDSLKSRILKYCFQLGNLFLSGCSKLKDPEFAGCSKLESLYLRGCIQLENPNFNGCSTLRVLDLRGCERLRTPDFSGCVNLRELRLEKITDISWNTVFSKLFTCTLKTLVLRECLELKHPDFYKFQNLEILKLEKITGDSLNAILSKSLPALKTLVLSECVEAQYPNFCNFKKLKVLKLEKFTDNSLRAILSQNLCRSLPSLRILDLSDCDQLEDSDFSSCYMLKVLNLAGCTQLRKAKFNYCFNLETLDLSRCFQLQDSDFSGCFKLKVLKLEKIPDASLNAILSKPPPSLESLDLSWCIKLKAPDFSKCTNLKSLYLRGCTQLKSPKFNYCSNLETLDLEECEQLKTSDFSDCFNLKYLNLSGCVQLQNPDFSNCSNLRFLYLSGCTQLRAPQFNNCSSLEILYLDGCENLSNPNFSGCVKLKTLKLKKITDNSLTTILSNPPPSLESLDLSGCVQLKDPNFSECSNLRDLNLRGCTQLRSPKFSNCSNLKKLNLNECVELQTLDFSNCSKLKTLKLKKITDNSLTTILSNPPPSLESLDLSGCVQLKDPNFSECSNLRDLNLRGCTQLRKPKFNNCFNLENLNLNECFELQASDFSDCFKLKMLKLEKITDDSLTTILSTPPPSLESLDLSGCDQLKDPNFSEYSNLRDLNLRGCTQLRSPRFNNCSNLENLNLNACFKLQAPDFRDCSKLKTLKLEKITDNSLTTILSTPPPSLESLDLSGCDQLKNPNFSACSSLRDLNLRGCTQLRNPKFNNCSNLENLNLNGCFELQTIDFNNCSKLKTLKLEEITNDSLTAILSNPPPSLESLDLSGCVPLKDPDFSECSNLRDLNLRGCTQLRNPKFNNCFNLENLNLNECFELQASDFSDCFKLKMLKLEKITDDSLTTILSTPPPSLESLDLSGCDQLKDPNFSEYSNLRDLNLRGCTQLRSPRFNNCSNLENLNLNACFKLQAPDFRDCSKLKTLKLEKITDNSLTTILSTPPPSLESLDLSGCDQLKNPNFSACSSLRDLNLRGCTQLRNPKFNNCSNLENLNLNECFELQALDFSNCSKLKTLKLESVTDTSLTAILLNPLPSLETLHLRGCVQLENCDFNRHSNFRVLRLRGFSDASLQVILARCPSDLRALSLMWCDGLEKITFERFPNLEELVLGGQITDNILNIILRQLSSSLKVLDLKFCHQLKNPNLEVCSHLEKLVLGCEITDDSLQAILSQCSTSLKTLDLKCCDKLQNPGFSNCFQLKKLVLGGCITDASLNNILSRCPASLEILDLRCSSQLQNPDFKNGSSLLALDLAFCYNLQTLKNISHCTELQELNLKECDKISPQTLQKIHQSLPSCQVLSSS